MYKSSGTVHRIPVYLRAIEVNVLILILRLCCNLLKYVKVISYSGQN